jgi:hypothetical protein
MGRPQTGVMTRTKELFRSHNLPTLWAAAREELAARHAAEAAHRHLTKEMADYASPSDRNDLNALLDSYPDEDVAELREALNHRIAA